MLALDDHGSGEPLVLVHGLATTRVIWRRVLPLVTPGRRVVTLDVPGFGGSPPAGPGFVLEDVAERIVAGLEEAGVVAPFDLVGHSMGGAVAIALARLHPGVVRRLVLVAPAGLRPMPGRLARAFAGAAVGAIAVRRQGAPLADLGWGRRVLMAPGTVAPQGLPPSEVRVMLAASRGARRIGEALATVASADLREPLAALTAPVGVVWGDGDRVIPPGGIRTVRALRPEAPVVTVTRAGHIPMMERPRAFADALEQVLDSLSRRGNIGSRPAA